MPLHDDTIDERHELVPAENPADELPAHDPPWNGLGGNTAPLIMTSRISVNADAREPDSVRLAPTPPYSTAGASPTHWLDLFRRHDDAYRQSNREPRGGRS